MTTHGITRRTRAARVETSAQTIQPLEQAALLRGRYALERLIEDEPLARTYIGRDLVLDRIIAVTVLQDHIAAKQHLVDRFLAVERRAGAVFHPTLVTIFDVGASDGACWSAHEYCGGGTLRQRLPARQLIPGWQVGSLLSQIGSALATLHRIGLVHGRISPDCIRFDDAGAARIGSVGLAAIADLPGLPAAAIESDGTGYLAPEQRERAPHGAAADQYALAAVAAELLCGSWHSTSLGARDADTDDLLTYLRKTRLDLPASSVTALARALSADPERRFSSVDDFLLAFSGGEVASAARPDLSRSARPVKMADDASVVSHTAPSADSAPTRPWVKVPNRAQVDRVRGQAGVLTHQALSSGSAALTRASGLYQHARTSGEAAIGRLNRGRRHAQSRAADQCAAFWCLALEWLRRLHPADRALLAAATVALVLALVTVVPLALFPPPSYAAPTLEGRSEAEARAQAAETGLRVAVRQEASSSAPAGQVIRQETPPGTLIRSDRPISLVVSSGLPPVSMPNILRRDLGSARQELESVGLTLGAVSEYDTNRQAWGTITAQSVRSGRPVPPGTAVDVTVAGPPWTDAPRLVNRGIGDVEKDLDGRGLKLGEVRLQQQDGVRAGTVIAQDPSADTRLRQGSIVSVTIAVPASGRVSP